MNISMLHVGDLDQWLDEEVSQAYKEQPLAQDWARVAKVIEELGETIQCMIGYTAQNPRKGRYASEREMLDEFSDTLITCALGIQHFTKDEKETARIITERWLYRMKKAGLTSG